MKNWRNEAKIWKVYEIYMILSLTKDYKINFKDLWLWIWDKLMTSFTLTMQILDQDSKYIFLSLAIIWFVVWYYILLLGSILNI